MIRLKNCNIEFPPPIPIIFRKADTLKEEGYELIGDYKIRRRKDYIPQSGMQELFGTINADLIFAGGQPGGGKSFGLMIEAARNLQKKNYNAIIVKKELVSTKAGGGSIVDFAKQIYLNLGSCNFSATDNPTFMWENWGTSIQFTHANFEGNTEKSIKDAQEKLKNKQASFIGIDELTDFPFSTFNYFFTRNRDDSGVRPKMICTFNTNGWHFTRTMIDWYIDDDNYVIPERLGKIRYFVLDGDSEHDFIWGNTKEEVLAKANIEITPEMRAFGMSELDMVKSFTFIPCKMMDNLMMMHSTQGAHAANVFNSGGSEQKKLFYGYWGETERGSHQLTNADIMAQFEDVTVNKQDDMYMTADIGDGGDPSIAVIWSGLTKVAREVTWTDNAEEKVAWLKGLLRKYKVDISKFAFDGSTIGNYIDDYMLGAVPIMSQSSAVKIYDSAGNLSETTKYSRLIDQLMDKLVAMHKTRQIKSAIKPYERVQYGRKNEYIDYGELCRQERVLYVKYEIGDKKVIKYESKNTFKKAFKYSPDDADCEKYRMIFELNTKERKAPPKKNHKQQFLASMYGNKAAINFLTRRK